MPYLHRLSSRLAASFAVLLTLGACGRDLTGNDPRSPNSDDGSTGVTTSRPPANPEAGWFIAPGGSTAGDGSREHPWSLSYALQGAGGSIVAGDTVWMLGGSYKGLYRSGAAGRPGAPIVFRQQPGEHATIDGSLRVDHADLVFWGFEILQTNPLSLSAAKVPGVETFGARTKFINLVIHDVAQQGISFWDGADDAEVYGCVVYNNGTHENLDHGTYVHNSVGRKVLSDNVFFNNLAFGIHVYAGPSDAVQRNVDVIGNVAFNNGTISTQYAAKGNILVGGDAPDEGMRVLDNMTYLSGTTGWSMWVGYTASNRDVEVRRNIVWGGETALVMGRWSSATITDNKVGGGADMVNVSLAASGQWWSRNQYYRAPTVAAWRYTGTAMTLPAWQTATGLASDDDAWSGPPSEATVVVRPNKYESGRGTIVVYNWTGTGAVSVDLSSVLASGQRFTIRNVQALYGAPVASGTYSGGTVTLSMDGVAPPARLGRSTPTPPRTAPYFDTFMISLQP